MTILLRTALRQPTHRTSRVRVPASEDGPELSAIIHETIGTIDDGWIVWAHGGSWHQGSAVDWQLATGSLAALSGRNVLSLDYRLAPQNRHPAAILDMLTAVRWVREIAPENPISVGGDSAGGTVAALAAIATRDRGETLHSQLLAYPPIDPQCRAASYHGEYTAFPARERLRTAWRSWNGPSQAAAQAPDGTRLPVSPRDADSLVGVCPAVLVVGDRDPVRDDVADYADRLRNAGVRVDHRLLPGIEHGDVLRLSSAVVGELAAAITDFPEKKQRKEGQS